jgi:hypothetical protein
LLPFPFFVTVRLGLFTMLAESEPHGPEKKGLAYTVCTQQRHCKHTRRQETPGQKPSAFFFLDVGGRERTGNKAPGARMARLPNSVFLDCLTTGAAKILAAIETAGAQSNASRALEKALGCETCTASTRGRQAPLPCRGSVRPCLGVGWIKFVERRSHRTNFIGRRYCGNL